MREPAVAGLFYPSDPTELGQVVGKLMRAAPATALAAEAKALIVPHAGYVYSGIIAAAGYALITAHRERIRRVVLIGPAHRVYLQGIAVPQADAFLTPLGPVRIDQELKAALLQRGDVIESDTPHELEHCLEVQLPFLQTMLQEFTLLPIVAGTASPAHVAVVLDEIWGGEETLVLVSSDLSHYHTYETAQEIDAATTAAILRREAAVSGQEACGAVPINGLLHLAQHRELEIAEIARCNSGDTAGDRARVVGYGAFAVHAARA